MQSSELYIGNLDPDVKPDELKEIFQMYGNVIRSEVKILGMLILEPSPAGYVSHG